MSVISTLNLVIHNSSSSIDSHAVCEPFEWIDGNTYTADNNTATWILTNSEGCDSIVTLNLSVTTINTSTNLVNGVIIQSNNTSAQYQWLDCDDNFALLNGQIGQSFYATTNGDYAVELTQNGCVDTSLCVLIKSVGVFENVKENGLFIYPNPTQNFITIDLGEQSNATAIITDLSGKIIDTKGILSGEQIDLTFLASGTYLIQISCQEVTKVFKVVKKN